MKSPLNQYCDFEPMPTRREYDSMKEILLNQSLPADRAGIVEVNNGCLEFESRLCEVLDGESLFNRLEPREKTIVLMLRDGKTQAEIAVELCVSRPRIAQHIKRMLQKYKI